MGEWTQVDRELRGVVDLVIEKRQPKVQMKLFGIVYC